MASKAKDKGLLVDASKQLASDIAAAQLRNLALNAGRELAESAAKVKAANEREQAAFAELQEERWQAMKAADAEQAAFAELQKERWQAMKGWEAAHDWRNLAINTEITASHLYQAAALAQQQQQQLAQETSEAKADAEEADERAAKLDRKAQAASQFADDMQHRAAQSAAFAQEMDKVAQAALALARRPQRMSRSERKQIVKASNAAKGAMTGEEVDASFVSAHGEVPQRTQAEAGRLKRASTAMHLAVKKQTTEHAACEETAAAGAAGWQQQWNWQQQRHWRLDKVHDPEDLLR
jgi:hypothetical protein